MSSDRSYFLQGARDAAPFLLGGLPFGLIVGIAAVNVGYGELLAIVNSVALIAGTAQLAAIQLIELGSTIAVIWVTTFFVNIRLLMYSITIAPYFRGTRRAWRFVLAFVLHDQAFALSLLRFQREPLMTLAGRRAYYLGVALPIVAMWYASTAAGALVGAGIPPEWSLDFAIPVAFLALIVPAIRDRPTIAAATSAGALSVLLFKMPLNLGLVTAIVVGMGVGLLVERAGGRPS